MPSSGCQTCARSEEHTSELQSHDNLVCRLLLEKKKCALDRKSTRLNSSHTIISYAVFFLKNKVRGSSVRQTITSGNAPPSLNIFTEMCVGLVCSSLAAFFFFKRAGAPPNLSSSRTPHSSY